jgi:hypothetical protein
MSKFIIHTGIFKVANTIGTFKIFNKIYWLIT